ncbi:GDSL esterase/lipase [Acorus calamus]|uniref:GDSL esterase/lipase n=1 Tax=Acorus calamus TaxID=4465 RepID=A0AAV9FJE8_ACOCL|nr:GDSL esterase/lipase [Acorus calamus]
MLWQLWRCHNEWIFRRQEPQPLMVATRVLIHAKECAQKLMKHTEDSRSLRILQSQVRMPFKAMGPCETVHLTGDSILLTDGSVDGQSGGAGAGFVAICTSHFRILGAGYAGWPWATPLRMEAEAIRLGVRFMRGQGIPISCICSDSLSLIQLLQSGSPGPPQVQDAIAEIQRTDSPLSAWQFCKVPRDLVRAPEVLARFARQKVESKWCLELHDPLILRRPTLFVVLIMMVVSHWVVAAVAADFGWMRHLAARTNTTALLVFGDSSVDPGNNNYLSTAFKSNFPPYGKDFFDGKPTGRLSNGTPHRLHWYIYYTIHFFFLSKVLPFEKQLEYLRHYKNHLRGLVGYGGEEAIVENAIFIVSADTNDFIQNYFLQPERAKQFTVPAYVHGLSDIARDQLHQAVHRATVPIQTWYGE